MKTRFLVDTNVLLRFLRLDDPKSTPTAMELFRSAHAGKTLLLIDAVIIAEAVWVLATAFKTPRRLIAQKLTELMSQEWIECPEKELIQDALEQFWKSSLDYIDCWLLVRATSFGISLETFDKRLKKSSAS